MIKAVDSLRGALIMKNEVMGGSRMTGFIFNIRMKCFLAAFGSGACSFTGGVRRRYFGC